MKTVHKITMSPRMERFWSLIKKHDIPLTDWSTDISVFTNMEKLLKLRRHLDNNIELPYRDELLRDLDAIIRRTPASRTS